MVERPLPLPCVPSRALTHSAASRSRPSHASLAPPRTLRGERPPAGLGAHSPGCSGGVLLRARCKKCFSYPRSSPWPGAPWRARTPRAHPGRVVSAGGWRWGALGGVRAQTPFGIPNPPKRVKPYSPLPAAPRSWTPCAVAVRFPRLLPACPGPREVLVKFLYAGLSCLNTSMSVTGSRTV